MKRLRSPGFWIHLWILSDHRTFRINQLYGVSKECLFTELKSELMTLFAVLKVMSHGYTELPRLNMLGLILKEKNRGAEC